jgi:putative transposase
MARNPFRYFKTSPEIIQLAVLMYVRFPLSLRIVEDLLHERGVDICHESVRLWGDRLGTYFAHKFRKRRSDSMRRSPQWQWHLDEVFVSRRQA